MLGMDVNLLLQVRNLEMNNGVDNSAVQIGATIALDKCTILQNIDVYADPAVTVNNKLEFANQTTSTVQNQ